jgi:peroxiredoxin
VSSRLSAGQRFPPFQATNIHAAEVSVPDKIAWVHVQFRRFAGCPVCSFHLRTFVLRHRELEDAGIKEVVVFHPTDAELIPHEGQFPFDVVGDPSRVLYRRYCVEASMTAILHPGAWLTILKGNLAKGKPRIWSLPTGGILGLSADFLVAPDGALRAVQYGKHAADQWSLDTVIGLKEAV